MSRLPEILVAAQLASRGAVEDAVRRAAKARACVVSALDHVDARAVVAALAAALDVDVFPLARVQPTSMGVPLEVLRRRRAVPVGPVVDEGVRFAVVVFADPTDEDAVTELARALGMPIRRALAADTDVAVALQKLGAAPRRASGGFDLDDGPTEIELPLSLDPRSTDVMGAPADTLRGSSDDDSLLFATADDVDDVSRADLDADFDADLDADLDAGGDTRRLLVDSGRVVLALSGGEALRLGDELKGALPGVVLQHDLGSADVLAPAPHDRVIFVEARDLPFPRGLLETLLWQRERIVIVSTDVDLDALKGVLRIEPGAGAAGLVDAVVRAAFLAA